MLTNEPETTELMKMINRVNSIDLILLEKDWFHLFALCPTKRNFNFVFLEALLFYFVGFLATLLVCVCVIVNSPHVHKQTRTRSYATGLSTIVKISLVCVRARVRACLCVCLCMTLKPL